MANWEMSLAFLFGIITLIFFYVAHNIDKKEHPPLWALLWFMGFLFINVDLGIALEIAKANSVSTAIINLLAAIWGISWIFFGFIFIYFLIMMFLKPTLEWFINIVSGAGKNE